MHVVVVDIIDFLVVHEKRRSEESKESKVYRFLFVVCNSVTFGSDLFRSIDAAICCVESTPSPYVAS